ncbi:MULTISPECIES: Bax inhibitor-1/YccA family protein [Bacteroidales]|uniref:Bax inhibitor-1/YccA family protein n=2 Tax=Muribaculum TaxID=1918540 RepID=A0A4V1D1W2_9BACT|nr:MULTISPECIES: Bax inhibitor-1/YccA family protein [Bacteroidales]QCD36598.1 Bax inhibitor-1/YccA family protein [Muribaculum gordoncarteri]
MNNYNLNSYNNQALDSHVSGVMKRVYVKMFLAMIVTALAAWACTVIPGIGMFLATHSWVYWGIAILELVLVFSLSGAINKMNSSTASLIFYLYSLLNGVTFAFIFMAYTPVSIFKTFAITAGVFGAMSIYGYFTERDLTKIGSFLTMAIIGLFIAMIVNIFWANSTLEWIVSIAGVIIFVGLTAWDTQKIKQWAESGIGATDGRLATIGALTLYLDFINLFLFLLRFFGASSRD